MAEKIFDKFIEYVEKSTIAKVFYYTSLVLEVCIIFILAFDIDLSTLFIIKNKMFMISVDSYKYLTNILRILLISVICMNLFLRNFLYYLMLLSCKNDIELEISRGAIIYTIYEVLDVCCCFTMTIFMGNEILKNFNNINVLNDEIGRQIFVLFSIYTLLIFIIKIYSTKSWWLYNLKKKRKYTIFIDGNGRRISELDDIIYKNRIYKIIRNNNNDLCLLERYKRSWADQELIELSRAVLDNEYKVEIYNYDY